MTEETKIEAKVDPVVYTDEDLKKMEADVKKVTGEDQSKKIEAALEDSRKEIARVKELEDLKVKQDEMAKSLADEKQKYAESLEKLKTEADENAKKLVDQLRDERQSVTDTTNPFKTEKAGEEDLKAKVRNDPEYFKEVDQKSKEAFLEHHNLQGFDF